MVWTLGPIFFSNEQTRDCAYFIDKAERVQPASRHSKQNYSREIMFAKSLAPAATQARASCFISDMRAGAGVSWCLKTRRFLSFHISHVISMAMVAMALRGTDGVVAVFSHHWDALSLGCHSWGLMVGCTIHSAVRFQILLVYLHSAKRWSAISGAEQKWGQDGECAHPLFCRRSDVQTRFCVISHIKNLYLRGAHDFQK